jgi:SAM-dependent methyltransferase
MTGNDWLPGVHPAPNIQDDPDLYELENEAADPDRRIEAAMRARADWTGRDVLDLGMGTGFHLPRFAETARHVYGVEPHDGSRLRAMARCVGLGLVNVSMVVGSAAAIPLADASVDLVHARFAYFWGPGSEPGIAEVRRVLRPGGTAFVIDNDLRNGTFAGWLSMAWGPGLDADAVEDFWHAQGWELVRVRSSWRFESRADLERVIRHELPSIADEILPAHEGLEVDYGFALYWRRF